MLEGGGFWKIKSIQKLFQIRPLNIGWKADMSRLKEAATDPAALTQAKILKNLDPAEKMRLTRIRNIGTSFVGTY